MFQCRFLCATQRIVLASSIAVTDLNPTCVLGFELDYGLSSAGKFDLVLRSKSSNDYMKSVTFILRLLQRV